MYFVRFIFVALAIAPAFFLLTNDSCCVAQNLSPPSDRSRLVVMADMGNEPDEQQQMVHLLMYANRVDLEGLIACSGKYLHAGKSDGRTRVRPDLFEELVDGYESVVQNLEQHETGWPSAKYLRSIIKAGTNEYGIRAVEPGKSNEASKLIESAITKDDSRNLYIVGNAGTNTLAQALVDLNQSRTVDQMTELCRRIIVFENGAQDNSGAWIASKYPTIRWHRSNHQTYGYGGPDRDGVVKGPYTWEPYDRSPEGQNEWAKQHIMSNHGKLGSLFPARFMRRLHFIEGGGTTPWMGLVNAGLTDPEHLNWGGWSGRFSTEKHPQVLSRHKDIRKDEQKNAGFEMFEADSESETWTDPVHRETFEGFYVPVWRFRRAMFNEFQARMDWCVKDYDQANHCPNAVVDGDRSDRIIHKQASPSDVLTFDASGSSDPDDDSLRYHWWVYPEAGTHQSEATFKIEDAETHTSRITIPSDAAGSEIHLILEVWDDSPIVNLVDYRRIVIKVNDAKIQDGRSR